METGRLLVEVGQSGNYHSANINSSTSSSSEVHKDVDGDVTNAIDTVELLQLRLSRLQRSIGNILDTLYIIENST